MSHLTIAAWLAFLAACSSAPSGPTSSDSGAPAPDAGPEWIDSSPAQVGDDDDAGDAAYALDGADAGDAAYAPVCTPAGSCGGSWTRYTCPAGFTPPAESHCAIDDANAHTFCCYGRAP